MTFLLPQFLWALLALAPLAVVYLIKVRPRRRKTSAWFLWQGVFQERRAASWLQKLRDWLSLALMTLAFILLVLALARPVSRNGASAERLVLIVDNSLSMNAADRLAEARRAAMGLARSLPAGGRASVFALGEELVSASGFTASRRELSKGLDAIQGSDAPLNIAALDHFFGPGDTNGTRRVILFSDGCFAGADQLPEGIELVKVGEPGDNVGITAFDVQRIPGADRPLGIFFQVFSSAEKEMEVDAVLTHETADDIRRIFPLILQPGLNEPEILELPNGDAGRWILTLEIDDALERDNVARAVVQEASPVRVAVRAPETRAFWRLCVEAFGEGVSGLMLTDENPALTLYRGEVDAASTERLAVFAPTGASAFWQSVSGEPTEATARVLLPEHPLARYADLDGMVFNGVRDIVPPEQSIVVVETDDGTPLVYKTSSDGSTAYVFNFDPALNHFFLHPLFPVLIWSTAAELMNLEDAPYSMLPAGAVAELPAGFEVGEVSTPDGEVIAFSGGRFGPLERFGFYEVTSGTNRLTVACGGAPVAESGMAATIEVEDVAVVTGGFPLSDWFLAAALLLMALECALYHRRKVG
ncbi:BatA domain-containing protein [Pontiellaceae bacterium B1224]|nr:BatA domain-containing protein [Pontiellaceae bacterium B1224]